jgi:hypothetical protein
VGFCGIFGLFSTPEQNPALGVLSTPAHPQVTQTVSVPLQVKPFGLFQKYVLVKSGLSLQNQVLAKVLVCSSRVF